MDQEPDPGRMAVVFSTIGPGHHARLEAAGTLGEVCGVELTSLEGDREGEAPPTPTSYRRVTLLPGRPSDRRESVLRVAHEAFDKIQPSVVAIPGWSNRASLAALDWCLQRDAAVVLMADTHLQAEQRAGLWRSLKSRIVRLCGAGLVAGSPQVAFLERLGMPRERIFTGYDVVDNDHFAAGARKARETAEMTRALLGLPPRYFLCVSRLVAEKNLPLVIRAFHGYRQLAGDRAWSLVLVGEGPERTAVESLIEALGLEGKAVLAGYRDYGALSAYYGLADAFILASVSETWGLAVNEAMAAGLPVLVSRRCGCTTDLVHEGVNGFAFDPRDEGALAERMFALSTSDLQAMGRASREIIARWPLQRFAHGLWAAAGVAHQGTMRRGSPLDRFLVKRLARR
jgi:glycosyltransferase involved in cell wall biosynthesis